MERRQGHRCSSVWIGNRRASAAVGDDHHPTRIMAVGVCAQTVAGFRCAQARSPGSRAHEKHLLFFANVAAVRSNLRFCSTAQRFDKSRTIGQGMLCSSVARKTLECVETRDRSSSWPVRRIFQRHISACDSEVNRRIKYSPLRICTKRRSAGRPPNDGHMILLVNFSRPTAVRTNLAKKICCWRCRPDVVES